MLKIIYDDLLKKAENIDAPIHVDLKWILSRCILESKPLKEDKEVLSDENGKNLINAFLNQEATKKLLCEDGEVSDKKLKHIDCKEFQKLFFRFLSNNPEMDNDPWRIYPEHFINKLSSYRHQGSTDQNISDRLMDFARKINNDPLRYIYELIQNADDCEYRSDIDRKIDIDINDGKMIVSYPENGMTYSDIIAITTIGESNKKRKKKKRIIGEKGIGFKTIFSVCDKVELYSGPYRFLLRQDSFEPKWIEEGQFNGGTKLILHFMDTVSVQDAGDENQKVENELKKGKETYRKILEKYGLKEDKTPNPETIFKNCPIFFTNKIDKICISYGNEKLIIGRTIQDGETIISYWINKNETETPDAMLRCLRFEKRVSFEYDEYKSHYKEIFTCKEDYPSAGEDVITYPVILLVPIEFKYNDCIQEDCGGIKQGNIFTYLPTFSNIKAPISIQIPYELNEDRSCMWLNNMKGEDHTSEEMDGSTTKWNKRLFKEVFLSEVDNKSLLEQAFEGIRDKVQDVFFYLPKYQDKDYRFFLPDSNRYDADVESLNDFVGKGQENKIYLSFKNMKLFKTISGKWMSVTEKPVMFDEYVAEVIKEEKKKETDISVILADLDLEDSGDIGEKIIEYVDLKKYKAIEVLGISQHKIHNDRQVTFANRLIDWNYKYAVNELLKPKSSEYLPMDDDKWRKLKLINVQNTNHSRWAVEDAELWIKLEDYYSQKPLGIYDRKLNTIGEDQEVLDIFGDKLIVCEPDEMTSKSIWSCIWGKIYSDIDNKKEVKCSYELYKRIMDVLRITDTNTQESIGDDEDWFQYTKALIESDDEENRLIRESLCTLWQVNYEVFREEEGHNVN